MTKWAKSNFGDHRDGFESLHMGLSVELIATPRHELKVCSTGDRIADVVKENVENYDYLPVVRSRDDQKFVGLFHAKGVTGGVPPLEIVAQDFTPLSEETIIGADSSIFEFISDADRKPCRLVISGVRIVGLVSLSDLQRLPVRAALFALITGFEITMMSAIRKWYGDEKVWMSNLSDDRRRKLEEQKKFPCRKMVS